MLCLFFEIRTIDQLKGKKHEEQQIFESNEYIVSERKLWQLNEAKKVWTKYGPLWHLNYYCMSAKKIAIIIEFILFFFVSNNHLVL